MSTFKVVRGVETDVLFRLRKSVGGSLTDDDQWTDGSTAAQWPTVTVRNASGVDVTASFVKNISGDVFTDEQQAAGWQKHPTPSTGTIREGSVGNYRSRMAPASGLTLGDYTFEIGADIGGAPFLETHTLQLGLAGDSEIGAQFVYATEEDVTDNFELTVVTSDQVKKALTRAERMVNARYRRQGLAVPQAQNEANNLATVAYARAELRRLIAGISGAGLGVKALTEGDTKYEFVSPETQAKALYEDGDRWMEDALTIALGGPVYFHVGEMGNAE